MGPPFLYEAKKKVRVVRSGLLLVLALVGCQGHSDPATRVISTSAPTPLKNLSLSGQVGGPAPGILANNSANILSGNTANIISDHAAGILSGNTANVVGTSGSKVIGNNGGRVTVLADPAHYAVSSLVPLPAAQVEAFDVTGSMLAIGPASTDGQGRFDFQGWPPAPSMTAGAPVELRAAALVDGRAVTLAAFGTLGGPIILEPATTLVARKLEVALATHVLNPADISPELNYSLGMALAPLLNERGEAAALLLDAASAATVFDALAGNPAVAAALQRVGAPATLLPASPPPSAAPSPRPTDGSDGATKPVDNPAG